MNMNLIRVHIRIISVMSVVIWTASAWEISSWIIIWKSIWHHRFASININNIIANSNINSAVMVVFGYLRGRYVFRNALAINIYYIHNVLSMLCDLFRIINFVQIFNIERITNVRIYKFPSIFIENIVPIIVVFKLLSKHILYLL